MKPIIVLVGILCALGAGAAGALLVSPASNGPQASVEPRSAVMPSGPAVPVEVQREMDALNMQIAALEAKIADLQQAQRRVSAEPAAVAPAASPAVDAVASIQRDAILKVIEEDRRMQELKREEERKKREQEALEQRADRVATKLNLNSIQKNQLVDLYGQERTKMDALREQFQGQGGPGADGFANARESFRDIRDWKSGELTKLYGAELGGQILEMDGNGFRGGVAGGGGGGNGGGNQGGNNPRRANRNGQGGG